MWQKITSAFAKRRALKKLHIRINQGSIGLHKKQLVLEPGVSLAAAKLAAGRLHIGAMTYLRSGCELGNVCSIGRFCSIGNNVILGQERTGHPLNWVSTHPFQHSMASQRYELTREPTQVDHDVWIGRDAIVMEGVTLGTGSVIGARAIVTRDVPPYAIVAGTPARILRYRHEPDVIEALLQSRWWEYSVELLQQLPTNLPREFLIQLATMPVPTTSPYPVVML